MLIGLAVLNASLVAFMVYAMWKLNGIFSAFDKIILKTLTDTTMIEKHKLFVDVLSKFSEADRSRKDKEYSELKALSRTLETTVKMSKSMTDNLRKDR